MPTIREWQLEFGGVASRSRTDQRVQRATVVSPLRRRISAVLGVGLFVRLLPAVAEEKRVARVAAIVQGSIVPGGPAGPLSRALRDLGWMEGRNIAFDRRGVDGDKLGVPCARGGARRAAARRDRGPAHSPQRRPRRPFRSFSGT